MSREHMPNRRPNMTVTASWMGHTIFVTIGYDGQTRIREVFGSSARMSSDIDFLVRDACVLISIALQSGNMPSDLAKSLNVVPDPVNGEDATKPASPVGIIVEVLVREEQRIAVLKGGSDG